MPCGQSNHPASGTSDPNCPKLWGERSGRAAHNVRAPELSLRDVAAVVARRIHHQHFGASPQQGCTHRIQTCFDGSGGLYRCNDDGDINIGAALHVHRVTQS